MPIPVPDDATAPPLPGATLTWVVASLTLALLSACSQTADIRPGDIRHARVPNDAEPEPPAPPMRQAASGGEPRSDSTPASRLSYELPEGWQDGGPSGMRLATLFIGNPADQREVTIIPASGSLAGNVERWQGQLDAGADANSLTERATAAMAAAETVDAGGREARVVLLRAADGGDMAGQAILGAMIPIDDSSALFVKFKGDAEVAARERERFTTFVTSIRWKE